MSENIYETLASVDKAIKKLELISKEMHAQAEQLTAINDRLQEMDRKRKLTVQAPAFPADTPILPGRSQLP
jgi:DNA repair ATPase RecN